MSEPHWRSLTVGTISTMAMMHFHLIMIIKPYRTNQVLMNTKPMRSVRALPLALMQVISFLLPLMLLTILPMGMMKIGLTPVFIRGDILRLTPTTEKSKHKPEKCVLYLQKTQRYLMAKPIGR